MIDGFTKKIINKSIYSIVFFASIYIIYSLLSKSGIFSLILTILFVSMAKDFWPVLKDNAKKYVKSMVIISSIILISMYFMKWGVIGFLIVVLLLAGWKLWRGREMYVDGMRNIETQIWGEPLDKVKQCSKNETEVKDERN